MLNSDIYTLLQTTRALGFKQCMSPQNLFTQKEILHSRSLKESLYVIHEYSKFILSILIDIIHIVIMLRVNISYIVRFCVNTS
jgi:hypothetical protein